MSASLTKLIQANRGRNAAVITNRNIFLSGEKIWFKAYAANPVTGKPDLSTKNLFVELLNDKDSTVQQLVLNNAELKTTGACSLADTLPTGIYWIRAYTAMQATKADNDIFLHPLYIINRRQQDQQTPETVIENNQRVADNHLQFQFFPERVTAIPGVLSTGVVEIRNNFKPVITTGQLLNSRDSVIVSFKTNVFGLARITFLNDPSETYHVIINRKTKDQFPLTLSSTSPVQLSIMRQTDHSLKAFVTLEEAAPADMYTNLLAVHGDSIYFASVGSGNYGINIPDEQLTGGITRLLLFDENDKLLSERSIYIPKENVVAEIILDKNQYKKRDSIHATIKLAGTNPNILSAMLSVSVEEQWISKLSDSLENTLQPPFNAAIFSSWLNQNHYKYSADDIDLLMLARKTALQSNVSAEKNEFENNEKLLSLHGTIINRKGHGLGDRVITAIAKNADDFFLDTDTTNSKGVFAIPIPQGFDSLKISLQVSENNSRVTDDSIRTDVFQFPQMSSSSFAKKNLYNVNQQALSYFGKFFNKESANFRGKDWLPNITVKAVKKEELNYDASKRINSISQIVTRDKFRFGGSDAIGNAVLMMPGVSYFNGDIAIFGPAFDLLGHVTGPLLVVDGVAIGNGGILGYLNSLNPADIDFIEVLRGAEAGFYGMRGGAGVVSVNTRHTADRTDVLSKVHVFMPATYHVPPIFNMPDYANASLKESDNPDPRTAIYWNGDMLTDKIGEAQFRFFAGDGGTNYVITIRGLTGTGEVVYTRAVIAVK